MKSDRPRARTERLVVRELPGETLVYDRDRDRAHCLNQTAALVWKYSDGLTSVSNITKRVKEELKAHEVDETVVWYAIRQLGKSHLLEERVSPPATLTGMSRRDVARILGVAIAVPLVTSVLVDSAAAQSCVATGQPCTTSAQCCSGLCLGSGTCA